MAVLGLQQLAAAASDDWVGKIRRGHPRLLFSAEDWPEIEHRALTAGRDHFEKMKQHAASPHNGKEWAHIERPKPRPGTTTEVRDWGDLLMSAALVQRIEPDAKRLARISEMLQASLDYYHACYAQGDAVHWYSRSRIGWLAAVDWLWDDLAPDERERMGQSMLRHVHDVIHQKDIRRRNRGGHTTGYYGGNNLCFFAGVLFLNEGIDDAAARILLKRGYATYQELLAHRSRMAGDDGGAASPTLGYSFNDYPHAEWTLLYTWQAATGESLSGQWPYIAMLPNYVLWNRLPGGLEFGYGDNPHIRNLLPRWWQYTHNGHILQFYGRSHPGLAAVAARVRTLFPKHYHHTLWSVYPLLMTRLEDAPAAIEMRKLPHARHFENMGQIFMRSGGGETDTYALFACGGLTGQHRHYDATHFGIFRQGYLALDTGTREGNSDSLQNYFAQTVAHNCVLIKMPGEPPSPYWNGQVYGQAGGQNRQVGSKVIAFETNDHFTYVAGDATPVYSADKCALAVRQFVFIHPRHFVVFDRVTSTRAEYGKRWLLHHANEPFVLGNTWRSDHGQGRLFCRTLLPEDAVLTKVGGPGKEFVADGVNYPITAGPSQALVARGFRISRLEYKETPELMGRWRMEVRPGSPRREDTFLHLIEVGDQAIGQMCEASVVVSTGRAEVTFADGTRTVTLGFPTTGPVAGHIRMTQGRVVLVDRELTREVMPQSGLGAPRPVLPNE